MIFEPVSAWACRLNHKDCIGLSHRAAVLKQKKPCARRKGHDGQSILKNYAPVTDKFGFHFKAYDKKFYPGDSVMK